MSEARPAKTPVTILTGFLGSGKTSLLNGALKDPDLGDSAVVVNELGEIALDHLLVSQGQENVVLTQTGCLCCAALESLPETLLDLFARRARAEVPDFRRVFIETTGLADPAPILRVVLRDPVVSHFARLDGLICTVDAVLGTGQLDAEHEAQAQAAMADRIILTKTDAVGASAKPLTARLKRLNAACEILDKGGPADFAHLLRPLDADLSLAPDASGIGLHAGHRHDAGVTSVSVWIDAPATWAGLASWTDWARARFGVALLRCKGLLAVSGASGPVAVQGVQTLFETTRLPAWPDPDHRSRLVLIGRGLSRPEILASLPLLSTMA